MQPINACQYGLNQVVVDRTLPCEMPPSCHAAAWVIQKPISPVDPPPIALFRLSPWFDSFVADGLLLDDEALLDRLQGYARYRLRDAPVDSILLAYFHYRDDRRRQELSQQLLESSIITPGIRASSKTESGWASTAYGRAYLELLELQDVWGGGRFA